jgi:hypothetical protein
MRARAASTRTGSRLIGRSALAATLWKVIGTPGMAAIVQRLRAATHGEPGAADDFGGRAGQLALPL